MKKIEKLTEEQEEMIPVFLEKWVNYLTAPMDYEEIESSTLNIYKRLGINKKPLFVYGDSPIHCIQLSAMLHILNNEDFNPKTQEELKNFLDEKLQEYKNSKELEKILKEKQKQISSHWYLTLWWKVWAGYYNFANYIGVEFDKNLYNDFINFVKNIDFIIAYEDVIFISKHMKNVHFVNNRLHANGKKAVEFEDGTGFYAYEGVRIPDKYGSVPFERWDPKWIFSERNAEIRTKILKEVGYERFLKEANCQTLDTYVLKQPILRPIENSEIGKPDIEIKLNKGEKIVEFPPENCIMVHGDVLLKPLQFVDSRWINTGKVQKIEYELLECNESELGKMKFLKMKNPSVKGLYHVEPVANLSWIKTCNDALQWRFGKNSKEEQDLEILWLA